METARVDICYRPLRIAWAIQSGDHESFRRAVRLTHCVWGGRFNPIVMVDRAEEAKQIVELFGPISSFLWEIRRLSTNFQGDFRT
jgi:hypothetical protein